MSDEKRRGARGAGRIGSWRLLDLVQATAQMRSSLMGGIALPELGPPDLHVIVEPEEELPGSNIEQHEQQQAQERERMRRWASARRADEAPITPLSMRTERGPG
jgi:hypothetical protein